MESAGGLKRTVSFSSDNSENDHLTQIRITPEPATISSLINPTSRIEVNHFPASSELRNRIQVTNTASVRPTTIATPQTYSSIEEEASLHRVILKHQQSEKFGITPHPIIQPSHIVTSGVRRPSITVHQASTHTHESLPTKMSVRRNSQSSEVFVGEPYVTKTSDVTRVFPTHTTTSTTVLGGAVNPVITEVVSGLEGSTRLDPPSVHVTNTELMMRTRYSPLAGYPVQGGHPRLLRPPYFDHSPYEGHPNPRQLTIDRAQEVIGMNFTDAYTMKIATEFSTDSDKNNDAASQVIRRLSRKVTEALSQNTQTVPRALEELSHALQRSTTAPSSARGPSSYKCRESSRHKSKSTVNSPVSPVIVFEDPRRTEGCCNRARKILIYTDEGDVESHYAF